ncbi:EfeM/EfeO family lipoprotein [Nocardia sp. NEAU-G5]|uniref:EfeM/EfeO family lipoprotein n=1 Tax=Nocardia albiluteola TaxID=2842303 RepID=A0ABS6AU68_9NOCA|nr:EfeM/EfeO family lipoprotein [Nocardia albiluteola]MBU3061566.1 EfeM/EfeO family lipoprotein [Nocardia albiluteola]
MDRKGPARGTVAAIVAAAATMGVSACGHAPVRAQQVIQVSENACGTGWSDPHAGQQTLYFRNTGSNPTTADLIDAGTGAIYAEIPNIGPNTTRGTRVNLGGGTFAVRCAMEGSDNALITGPKITIPGKPVLTRPVGSASSASSPSRTAAAIQPVTAENLYGPDKQYTDYVAAGLSTLATDTDALRAAVDGGDAAAARTAWLTAHLDYERLGAAYDAFADFDDKLDGRAVSTVAASEDPAWLRKLPPPGPPGAAAGLPGGTADPQFTGFHRLEYGLWHGEPLTALAGATGQLDDTVHALVAAFPSMQVPLLDLGLRTHEILENTLQFELTGQADYGSGTGLATATANVAGTRELLTVLDPLLRSRYPQLPQVTTWLDRFESLVNSHHTNGTWTPVAALSLADRQHLNGTLSQLLEYLAPIATICTPRKTFQ